MKVRLRRQLLATTVALTMPATLLSSPVLPTAMVAIARAACPPDCGGGPGNGGTPTGPPNGGTEFQPPQPPQLPQYEAGRGYPGPDQNAGLSIYNQSGPQGAQVQQPAQQQTQVQAARPWSHAANGEQQPIEHEPPHTEKLSEQFEATRKQFTEAADPAPAPSPDPSHPIPPRYAPFTPEPASPYQPQPSAPQPQAPQSSPSATPDANHPIPPRTVPFTPESGSKPQPGLPDNHDIANWYREWDDLRSRIERHNQECLKPNMTSDESLRLYNDYLNLNSELADKIADAAQMGISAGITPPAVEAPRR